jgi:hypothetical protein
MVVLTVLYAQSRLAARASWTVPAAHGSFSHTTFIIAHSASVSSMLGLLDPILTFFFDFDIVYYLTVLHN